MTDSRAGAHVAPQPFAYRARIERAIGFAAQQHAQQRRKGTGIPYIVHPVHVALMLERHGFDEEIIIAGLLHDVLEDTDCRPETLTTMFGTNVTRIVLAVSEPDKSLPWETRKADAVLRMGRMDHDERAVCCADKAHNLHTIADALGEGNRDIWKRFHRGQKDQIAYHRHALAALANGFEHTIVDEMRGALDRVLAQIDTDL